MMIKLMRVALLALALASCTSSKPIMDSRTGKPMMAGPWENRDLSLTTYKVNVFGKAILTHAYIQGVNISKCYSGARPDDVRLVMVQNYVSKLPPGINPRTLSEEEAKKYPLVPSGDVVPGYVDNRDGGNKKYGMEFKINGIRKKNTITQKDGTKQEISWMQFDDFCHDRFAGGGTALSIRNAARESIPEYVQFMNDNISSPDRRNKSFHYIIPPGSARRGSTLWTYFRAFLPGPGSNVQEDWMLPIGDSSYDLHLMFFYYLQAQEANDPDYLNARKLFDGMLDSVKVEKP